MEVVPPSEAQLYRSVFKAAGPFKAREIMQWRKTFKNEAKGIYLVAYTSNLTDRVPGVPSSDNPELVRAHQHFGCWRMTPWVEGGVLKGTDYYISAAADPRGYLPQSVVNNFGWLSVNDFVNSLIKGVKKDIEIGKVGQGMGNPCEPMSEQEFDNLLSGDILSN